MSNTIGGPFHSISLEPEAEASRREIELPLTGSNPQRSDAPAHSDTVEAPHSEPVGFITHPMPQAPAAPHPPANRPERSPLSEFAARNPLKLMSGAVTLALLATNTLTAYVTKAVVDADWQSRTLHGRFIMPGAGPSARSGANETNEASDLRPYRGSIYTGAETRADVAETINYGRLSPTLAKVLDELENGPDTSFWLDDEEAHSIAEPNSPLAQQLAQHTTPGSEIVPIENKLVQQRYTPSRTSNASTCYETSPAVQTLISATIVHGRMHHPIASDFLNSFRDFIGTLNDYRAMDLVRQEAHYFGETLGVLPIAMRLADNMTDHAECTANVEAERDRLIIGGLEQEMENNDERRFNMADMNSTNGANAPMSNLFAQPPADPLQEKMIRLSSDFEDAVAAAAGAAENGTSLATILDSFTPLRARAYVLAAQLEGDAALHEPELFYPNEALKVIGNTPNTLEVPIAPASAPAPAASSGLNAPFSGDIADIGSAAAPASGRRRMLNMKRSVEPVIVR